MEHTTLQSTILLVDDAPESLSMLSAILQSEGYKVRAAINGPMALSTITKSLPDLILLDISMPDMAGYREIGATRKQIHLNGQPIQLTPIEYKRLRYLADHVGNISNSRDIVRVTHGIDVDDEQAQSLLQTHIRNLRKKIGHSFLIPSSGKEGDSCKDAKSAKTGQRPNRLYTCSPVFGMMTQRGTGYMLVDSQGG